MFLSIVIILQMQHAYILFNLFFQLIKLQISYVETDVSTYSWDSYHCLFHSFTFYAMQGCIILLDRYEYNK